jgi:TetR/AcrR family tetracycline transcriptional repressor
MTPERDDDAQRLTRERLVRAALELIQEEGLDGLSMRALAERLDVKAASIYWHVRDRKELLELLAQSILDSVRRPRGAAGWRARFTGTTAALRERVAAQNDAPRILFEVPDALAQSGAFRDLRAQLVEAGLPAAEGADVALMAMTYVIAGRGPAAGLGNTATAEPAELAIDSGSRGVTIRSGGGEMETLVRVPPDRSAAPPAVVQGERVVVRRLRGVGRGELELNPRRPWRLHVQAPTWNTLLDVRGLDVRGLHIDSGAAKVEVFLPRPAGLVPIHISSGVVDVVLHRPLGTAVVADLSTGAVQVRLDDDFSTKATLFDTHWESQNASANPDRFGLRVSSGAVTIRLDTYELGAPAHAELEAGADAGSAAEALDILLDGVEARIAAGRRG